MESLEKAIRSAFDKGDAGDPAFRKRVYRSALAALEKSAATNAAITDEIAASRRDNLKAIIRNIETEFSPAAEAVPSVEPGQPAEPAPQAPPVTADAPSPSADASPAVEPPVASSATEKREPAMDVEAPASPRAAPQVEAGPPVSPAVEAEPAIQASAAPDISLDSKPTATGATDAASPGDEAGKAAAADDPDTKSAARKRRTRRQSGLVVPFLIGSVILFAGGAYLYSKYGQTPAATGDGTRQESTAPASRDQDREDRRNWIGLFEAGDPSTVSASAGVELEILDRDQIKYLRINAKGSKTATVTFEVGQGAMRQLAGRQALFDFSARAQEGTVVEIAVQCDFGGSRGCGRKRYEVGFSPGDYLFDVAIPDDAGEAAGKIIVTPDSAGSGTVVDISALRAAANDAQ